MSRNTRIGAILKSDIKAAFRDFEQLLLVVGLPVLFLVFFSQVEVIEFDNDPIDFLAPGILTLGLLSIAFVRLAIGIGFDRTFGAIRRFSMTPLKSNEFLTAKILVTILLFAFQVSIITGVAVYLGWEPSFKPEIIGALLLALIIFSALAFIVGGLFEGLTSLAIANSIYILLLLFSGLIFEISKLPALLADITRFLPSTALGEILRNGFAGETSQQWPWLTLLAWGVVTPIFAIQVFRWK